ncbi:uncharacterized protein TNCV_3040271 [Trichonephila clavipes]|nr:uncharacterized protein TNCV_3040271 [Trichonephila clavipes]
MFRLPKTSYNWRLIVTFMKLRICAGLYSTLFLIVAQPRRGHLTRRALDWFQVLCYRVVEDKTTDYALLKQALTEQYPVVTNRSELGTRFFASSQKHNQKPSDFVYDLLNIHKILKLEMTEEKLIDHVISRLEPHIVDYVEVRHPQMKSNLLQIIDKYEERFLNRKIRGSIWEFRDTNQKSKLTLDFDQKSLIIPDDQIKQLPKVEKPVENDLSDTKLDEGQKD